MSKILNIGVPSKGRIKTQILDLFKKNKLTLLSERGERDLLVQLNRLKMLKFFIYIVEKL